MMKENYAETLENYLIPAEEGLMDKVKSAGKVMINSILRFISKLKNLFADLIRKFLNVEIRKDVAEKEFSERDSMRRNGASNRHLERYVNNIDKELKSITLNIPKLEKLSNIKNTEEYDREITNCPIHSVDESVSYGLDKFFDNISNESNVMLDANLLNNMKLTVKYIPELLQKYEKLVRQIEAQSMVYTSEYINKKSSNIDFVFCDRRDRILQITKNSLELLQSIYSNYNKIISMSAKVTWISNTKYLNEATAMAYYI